jgi:ubiquinone biosynthesis protein UbiJ
MNRSTIDQLTSLGEKMLDKATKDPRASKVVQSAMQMRERVDDLAKRVSGLEALDKRVARLETRLSKLERSAKGETPPKRETAAKPKPKSPPPS